MNDQSSRLRKLLQRNMFLTRSDKQAILVADKKKQSAILPLLERMDLRQTKMFKKVLKKNPNFFDKLDVAAQENADLQTVKG